MGDLPRRESIAGGTAEWAATASFQARSAQTFPNREGDHKITARPVDRSGNVPPAMDDPIIAKKRIWWRRNGQFTRQVGIS